MPGRLSDVVATRIALTSVLQEEILRNVCRRGHADLSTLMKDVRRDRATILQSLRLLTGGFYVRKHKVAPGEKSKLYFVPTEKGVCYALAFLGLDTYDVVEDGVEGGRLWDYVSLVKQIRNRQGGSLLLKNLAQMSIIQDSFRRGNFQGATDIIFKSAIVTALDLNKDYTVEYNPAITYLFAFLFSPDELSKFKKTLVKNR